MTEENLRTEQANESSVGPSMLMLALFAEALVTVESHRIRQAGDGFDIRITAPKAKGPHPVIVWSHGMGGSKDAYQPLVRHWAQQGYVVIQPTHADSITIDRAAPRSQRTRNWAERPAQISAILDELPNLGRSIPEVLGKIDATRVAVGGHSFGAQTAQLLSGTDLRVQGRKFEEKRAKAFVWISPQGTGAQMSSSAWKGIQKPVLLITGDNDASPLSGQPAKWRLESWEGLSPGDKHLLWVHGAYHGFGGISGRVGFPGSGEQIPKQVEAVQKATTAFWNAYLKGDSKARAELRSGKLVSESVAKLTSK